jgi:predicted methyltransferase
MEHNHKVCTRSISRFTVILLVVMSTLGACAQISGMRASPESAPISKERIAAIVASPDRRPADRTNDQRRKPEQILEFIGVRTGMTALDLSAGGGYTTELLARAVGPGGKVYGQSAPRNPDTAPPASPEASAVTNLAKTAAPRPASVPSPVALAERAKNPALSHIVPIVRPFEDPAPPEVASNGLDLVTFMFNYHDMGHLRVDRARLNKAVFAALKPGGMYVIGDHSGRPGTGILESGTLHRIEEAFLRQEVEAAGFMLAAQGNFLRNPSDPRDKNTAEPPQPKDGFILKFIKPSGK